MNGDSADAVERPRSYLATWGDRAAAFLLDVLLLLPLAFVAVLLVDLVELLSEWLAWCVFGLWLYGRLLDSFCGQSPAKALMGLHVLDSDGAPIVPAHRAVLRWIFGVVFIFALAPINYLIAPLVSTRRRTLHDMIGGTVVVRDLDSAQPLDARLWAWRRPATSPRRVTSDRAVRLPSQQKWGSPLVYLAAVSVVIAILLADLYTRNRELDRLLDAVEESERAMEFVQAEIADEQEELRVKLRDNGCLVQPTGFECQSFLSSSGESVRLAHSAAAANGAAAVRLTGAEVEGLTILPWHGEIRDARSSYREHSEAWHRYLLGVADDAAHLGDPGDGAEISATFLIAEARFQEAVPVWDLYDAEARIADTWAE